MANDDKKGDKRKFEFEFEYLEELVAGPFYQIHQIEKQLAELDARPREPQKLRYNPPGFEKAKRLEQMDKGRGQLERTRDEIDRKVFETFEANIKGFEPEVAGNLRKIYNERRYPNPFEDMNEGQLDRVKKMEKDVTHSQFYMLRKKELDAEKVKNRPLVPKVEKKSTLSPSQEFSSMLNYNRTKEEISKPKSPAKSKDIDEPTV